jgi:hypothetical protein
LCFCDTALYVPAVVCPYDTPSQKRNQGLDVNFSRLFPLDLFSIFLHPAFVIVTAFSGQMQQAQIRCVWQTGKRCSTPQSWHYFPLSMHKPKLAAAGELAESC